MRDRSRRRVLTGVSGTLVTMALAGCTDESGSGTQGEPNGTDSNDGTTNDSDLDLREANVVDVAVERTDEARTYAFDVTLHHDDDGEDGYANWWQVERLDGTRLGRRDLTHPHSQQPFTRSDTVVIPDDAACVVVRGHDEADG